MAPRDSGAQAGAFSPGRLPGRLLRLALLLVFLSVPAWLALQHFAVFEPYLYPLHRLQAQASPAANGVLVGPYPDYARLQQLQRSGYTIVVSLLSPDLVYEKSLIGRERNYTKALGLSFYEFPMRSEEPPTSPRNAAALRGIRELLAASPGQGAYIHCYLGKHRSRYVAQMLAGQPGR